MARRLPPLTWLRSFEAAARHVSFSLAAEELGVTPSAVSQQVHLLEEHLGRLLFHRLPRGLRLAEAGQSYLPLLNAVFERLSYGTTEIFGERSDKRVSVRSTVAFAAYWLAPRLTRFRAAHPDFELRLTSSIWSAEFPDPGIDLEIRFGNGDWPGLTAERLTWDRVFPVCSPTVAAGPPRLSRPAGLAGHALLHTIGFREDWRQWLKAAGADQQVDARGGLECDTAVIALELAMLGEGIALGRSCFVDGLLATGRLVAPFALKLPAEEAFYLAAPAGQPDTAAALAFRRWLRSEIGSARSARTRKGGIRATSTRTARKRLLRR
jgi:LysR family glycine cleavage system transcriptional activator